MCNAAAACLVFCLCCLLPCQSEQQNRDKVAEDPMNATMSCRAVEPQAGVPLGGGEQAAVTKGESSAKMNMAGANAHNV